MATNFPTSLDSLTNPATTDQLNSPSHAAQHANANDAIEQLQAKVGVNSSAVTTSHDYKIAQLEAAITAGVSGTKLIYQDVRNQSGVSLTKGTPVRVTGSDGASGKLLVGISTNANEAGSSKTFGLVSSTINNNSNGQVVTNGLLEGVDTTGAVDGDPVWLGASGAKIFGLANKPVAPAHLVYLGVVVRGGQQNTGSIFVSIQNGFEVEELHNVLISNLADKNALVYDSATQLWKNYDLSQDFVSSSDVQNSLGDYVPLNTLGQPSGPAELDPNGNLLVPENSIIFEGATADAHELTLQAPDVSSDITVTLPNASGTLATTTDISTAISNLVDAAPATLDTLNELAAALGDDANFATTVTTSLSDKASLASANTFTVGPQQINTGISTNAGLIIKGAVGQNAGSALTQWQSSTSSVLAQVTGTGRIYSSVSITAGAISTTLGTLTVVNPAASTIGAVIRAAASQTANLLEFQNSSGTAVTFFNSSGGLTATEGVISTAYSGGKMTTGTLGYFNATTFNAAVSPVVVRGAASQTADLQQWQNNAGTVLSKVLSTGQHVVTGDNLNNFQSIGTSSNLYNGFTTTTNTGSGSYVMGTAGSAETLFNVANSFYIYDGIAGAMRFKIMPTGLVGINSFSPAAQLQINSSSDSTAALIVKGSASQTANLQEWQNSSGAILARITAGGVIGTTQNIYANRYYYSSNGTDTGTSISFIDGANGGGLNIRNIDLGTPNAGFDNVVPLTISGNINQTANLQNWKNSAGTVLAKVDSTGAMFTVTPPANTNTTQVATTAYVQTELADLVNSAPATLDTLNELATALGNDASFSTTVTNSIALKAPLASPALTGTPTAPTAAVGTDSTQIATTAFVIDQIDASTQPGALYQTTAPTSPEIGQIWIDSDDNVTTFDSNIIRRKTVIATAGQTVFTTDVPFIDGFEQVFMNGLLLVKTTDYATSNSNTVTLTSGAAVSDIIEIVTVTGANSVSTYTQAETDALLAANTSVAPLSISANTTLVAKKRYFVTSASALTLTLPASPALNDEIQILDASGNASTYNITVARNGNKINGGTGNLIIDNNGGWYTLLYTGSTYGWKVG